MSIEIIIKNVSKEKVKEIMKYYENDLVAVIMDLLFEEIISNIDVDEVMEFANSVCMLMKVIARNRDKINQTIKVKFE